MRCTQTVEITAWDRSPYDETGKIQLGRATVGKTLKHDEQGARVTVD
jgi:hypothetical protein